MRTRAGDAHETAAIPRAVSAAGCAAAMASPAARADDAAVLRKLAPTAMLRVVSVALGTAPAQKLGVPVAFVVYPNSGALTEAADAR